MDRRLVLLGAGGALLGLAAQSVAFGWDEPGQWAPDLAVGWTFIVCGLIARAQRPASGTGPLMIATGFTWFAGNFAALELVGGMAAAARLAYLGPLFHCLLSFPSGRLPSQLGRAAVGFGYVAAFVAPQAEAAVVALGLVLPAAAVHDARTTIGAARPARASAALAAVVVGLVLVGGAAVRTLFPAGEAHPAVLLAHQATLSAVALWLLLVLLRASWDRAAVTDLVVELTGPPSPTLREALARTLGDPTIEVGYALPGVQGYVDARGSPLPLPEAGTGRVSTPIELDGQALGVLVHDPAVLDDPQLLGSVAEAARLLAANARLQAEVRAQIEHVQASRRRLVAAADDERRRLQARLRQGAEQRLGNITATLSCARQLATADDLARIELAERQLQGTLQDLHELARGLHPPALEAAGLRGALAELVRTSPLRIDMQVPDVTLPPDVAAEAYFLCAEALGNMSKHAGAGAGLISATVHEGVLTITIADDGIGGADASAGSGLRGLTDRVEALGGSLTLASPAGGGTRLTAEIPLGGNRAGGSADLREGLPAEEHPDQEVAAVTRPDVEEL
jgi:signal transduction histidine kinase